MAEFSSPIAGGLRAKKTRVSSYTFLNRPQEQSRDDFGTTLALQQNRIAIDNINSSLLNVSAQVSALNSSLQGIALQMRETSALEQAKENQKQRQEIILAEQQVREGKESVVERKIQNSLLVPVRKVGAKASFTLGRLGNLFTILLAGFLGNVAIQTISSLSSGNKERLESLKKKFLDNIGIVSGILLAITGGFGIISNLLVRLTSRLGSAVLNNLLLRPVNALLNLVKGAAQTLLGGIGVGPGKKAPPKASPTTRPPAKAPPAAGAGVGSSGGGKSSAPAAKGGINLGKAGLLGGGLQLGYDLLFGTTVGQGIAGATGAGLAGSLFAAGRYILPAPFKLPLTLASIFGIPFAANLTKDLYSKSGISERYPQLDTEINILGGATGKTPFIKPPDISGKKDTTSLEDPMDAPTVTFIDNGGGGSRTSGTRSVPNVSGEANYLPSVRTFNPDNFYVLYSQSQYNVVG